jgi:type II secretory pathway pseudopilin PulG
MLAPPAPLEPQHGYTLIELVAAITLTTVMIGVGVSAVRTYVARGQITESISVAAAVQQHVARAFGRTGMPPANRRAAGLSSDGSDHATRYLDSIDVVDGRVDLRFGAGAAAAVQGQTLPLTPFETADREIVWLCGNRAPGVGLQPLGFAGGGTQAVQVVTTIDARYLPAACR